MRVLKPIRKLITPLVLVAILPHLSNFVTRANVFAGSETVLRQEKPLDLAARFGRLRRGINLSHWFSQAADYTRTHLETHTTAQDIALIKSMGFGQVGTPTEPAPLMRDTPDPSILNATYLQYVDNALD